MFRNNMFLIKCFTHNGIETETDKNVIIQIIIRFRPDPRDWYGTCFP
jgi:hypothetical protein